MSGEGWISIAVLALAVVLFLSGRVRYDGVAVFVIVALAVTGALPVRRSIEGFGSPAVITVAAVLVLGGGLQKTGVASRIGDAVLGLAGRTPWRATALTMAAGALLSAVMNNIAAVALLMPAVLDVARRLRIAPSKMLIPLAWTARLGGMTTLIGTTANILVSGTAELAGLEPFGVFDFAPVGAAALLAGGIYLILIGRRLLPDRDGDGADEGALAGLAARYRFEDTVFPLRIPAGSALDGVPIARSRLGIALGLVVLAVRRRGRWHRAPEPGFSLAAGDVLAVEGRAAALADLKAWGALREILPMEPGLDGVGGGELALLEMTIPRGSELAGRTPIELDLRRRCGQHILALSRGSRRVASQVHEAVLEAGDTILTIGSRESAEDLAGRGLVAGVRTVASREAVEAFGLERRLLRLVIPRGSTLDGSSLHEARLREAFDITVLEIRRADGREILPDSTTPLRAGDELLVECQPEDFEILRALQGLERPAEPVALEELEADDAGFAEVTLSPASSLAGRTPREVFFYEKHGLRILAVWRSGKAWFSNVRVRDLRLAFGDALLLYGRRDRLERLANDPDVVVLAAGVRETHRLRRAPHAAAIMTAVVLVAAFGIWPIYLAGLVGALAMVAAGCIRGDEVYGLVPWRVVVLVGGMFALGTSLDESGAAAWLATGALGWSRSIGPRAVVATLFLLCGLGAQFVPSAAVTLVMAPVALSAASSFGLSPRALLMVVAIASSCAFLTPFGHPVNLLVMGPGGYRVRDYAKAGAGLFLILLLVVLLVLPAVWPLT